MNSAVVTADAKFLRRVLFGLMLMTVVAGVMAALTTVQAMEQKGTAPCILFCK